MSEGIDEADRPVVLEGAGSDLFSKFDHRYQFWHIPKALKIQPWQGMFALLGILQGLYHRAGIQPDDPIILSVQGCG